MYFKMSDKYNDDVYYISPFYPQIFPQLKRIMVIDLDMEVMAICTEIVHYLLLLVQD